MLSIVIPTFRQVPRLRLALRNVLGAARAEGVECEVLVVDDACEQEVASLVGELAEGAVDRLRYVASERAGRSGARNAGARAARGGRLLFLDGDVLVRARTLTQHAELQGQAILARGGILRLPWLAAFEDPQAGTLTTRASEALGAAAAGSALLKRTVALDDAGYPTPEVARGGRVNQFERDIRAWFESEPQAGRWVGVTGAHISVERSTFEALGGFDPEMGRRWGAEDLEFGFRAEAAGVPIIHLERSDVYHMDHDTSGRAGDHEAALEYFARKHGRPGVLRLLAYFEGGCALSEVCCA